MVGCESLEVGVAGLASGGIPEVRALGAGGVLAVEGEGLAGNASLGRSIIVTLVMAGNDSIQSPLAIVLGY